MAGIHPEGIVIKNQKDYDGWTLETATKAIARSTTETDDVYDEDDVQSLQRTVISLYNQRIELMRLLKNCMCLDEFNKQMERIMPKHYDTEGNSYWKTIDTAKILK